MRMRIKRDLPNAIYNCLRKAKSKMMMRRFFRQDIAHLRVRKKSPLFRKEILEGIITQEYHRIEKGLSKQSFREGFGQQALYRLMRALREYKERDFDVQHSRYRTGLSAIHAYIDRHENSDVDTSHLKEFLSEFGSLENEGLSGVVKITKEEIIELRDSNFELLSGSRHSIRYFSNVQVELQEINEAIRIAMRTPSACNRQGWKIRVITDKKCIEQFKRAHNGFANDDQNLSTLLLVTSMNNYFSYPKERHQGYIDAGLFSMSLIYALTYKGLATCVLNANLTTRNQRMIRELMNIDCNESMILFIAVGHYADLMDITKSTRDEINQRVIYI